MPPTRRQALALGSLVLPWLIVRGAEAVGRRLLSVVKIRV